MVKNRKNIKQFLNRGSTLGISAHDFCQLLDELFHIAQNIFFEKTDGVFILKEGNLLGNYFELFEFFLINLKNSIDPYRNVLQK